MLMGSPSTPPAPDYTAAANEQGEIDQQAMTQQTYANRPNQYTPWGMTSWNPYEGEDPVSGDPVTMWEQTQALNPQLQDALGKQFDVGSTRSAMAQLLSGQLGQYNSPIDYGQFQQIDPLNSPGQVGELGQLDPWGQIDPLEDVGEFRRRAEEESYNRLTGRLDPRFSEARDAMELRLRNRGLRSGDAAYEAEFDRFNRGKTDAYQAAMQEAVGMGRQESDLLYGQQMGKRAQDFAQMAQRRGMDFNQMLQARQQNLGAQNQYFGQDVTRQGQQSALRNQQIAEFLRQRQQPLQDINALLAGQGIQPAQHAGFMGAGAAPAPNLLGAANMQYGAGMDAYNAQQQQQQGMMNGMFGLASAGIGAF